jgi:acyl carrier protein
MSKKTVATRDEVRAMLTEVLAEIQDLGGEEIPEIGDETCPMKDLADFDSLTAVEAVTQLSERLSEELDPTLFWKKDGTPLTVEGIVERICKTINLEEGGRHD